jgi:hypothetical protein
VIAEEQTVIRGNLPTPLTRHRKPIRYRDGEGLTPGARIVVQTRQSGLRYRDDGNCRTSGRCARVYSPSKTQVAVPDETLAHAE